MTRGAFRGFQIFTVSLFLVCLALGAWQVQRHLWKADLLAQAGEIAAGAAIALPSDVGSLPAYQPLRLEGRFLKNRDIVIRGFAIQGVSGDRLYAPFELSDGRSIVIQRGWISRGQEDGREVIDDSLQVIEVSWRPLSKANLDQEGGLFSLVNSPEIGIWTHINTQTLARWWDQPGLIQEGYGELRGPASAVPELRIEPFRADLFNRHLEYVATWWSLAGILAVIYLLVWNSRRQKS